MRASFSTRISQSRLCPSPSRQKGMALLLVLFILALMVTVAVSMNEYWQQAMMRSQLHQFQQQARWSLLGAESLLQNELQQELTEQATVHTGQTWAQAGKSLTLEGVTVRVTIRDLRACLNLNALSASAVAESEKNPADQERTSQKGEPSAGESADASPVTAEQETPSRESVPSGHYLLQVFRQLLRNLNVEAARVEVILSAFPTGSETDTEYGAKSSNAPAPPAVPHHWQDISELRALPGMTPDLYRQLKALVCVLPDNAQKLNLNTLQGEQAVLLSALFLNQLSTSEAQRLIQQRPETGWESVTGFMRYLNSHTRLVNEGAVTPLLSVDSDALEALLWLEQEDNLYSLRSLLYHASEQWQVLQRRYGMSEQ